MNACGHAKRNAVRGEIPRDHRSGSDHGAIADRHPSDDAHTIAEHNIIADRGCASVFTEKAYPTIEGGTCANARARGNQHAVRMRQDKAWTNMATTCPLQPVKV